MAIAKITTWLNDTNRDYHLGVLLFQEYGKSDLQKVFFKNGNSAYHQDRLLTALLELNPSVEELTNKSSFNIPTLQEMVVPVKRYGVTDEVWDKLPDQIKDLYTANSKLNSHSQLLFNQARIASTDHDRAILARQILQERDKLNGNWKAIKDYFAQGKLKEVIMENEAVTIDQLSVAELTRQLGNIPSYLSKDRKAAGLLPDGSKKNKVLLRIKERESKMELIKTRLEGMK